MTRRTPPSWQDQLRELRATFEPHVATNVLTTMVDRRVFVDATGAESEKPLGFRRLDPHARNIYLAEAVVGDVLNGGLDQYFSNSWGAHAVDAAAALRQIGAAKMGDIVLRAVKVLDAKGVVPAAQRARQALLEDAARTRALEKLDDAFNALPNAEYPDLVGYALAHADALAFTKHELAAALKECRKFTPELRAKKEAAPPPRRSPIAAPAMPELQRGSCQCGAIRYTVSQAPLAVFVCHCVECRHQSASAFGISVIVPKDAVTLVRGTPKTWSRRADSGHTVDCLFCPTCGTRLWHERRGATDTVSVKGGSLDNPPDLADAVHIWTSRKLPGVVIPAGAVQFPEEPETSAR
jgi:hypothetical protein